MIRHSGTLQFRHFLLLWFGAAVSVAEILAGGLLAPLGFIQGVEAIVLGHLIGTALLVLGGMIGTRQQVSAIASTQVAFGSYGAKLFSVLNVLQLLGWTAVMVFSAAQSINEIAKILWNFDNFALWSLGIGGLILLWIALGQERGWKKLNFGAACLLLGLTVVLSFVVFRDSQALLQVPTGGMSFSEGVELSVVMPLSWLPLIADYTRFAKSEQGAAWGSGLGYFVGSCWMYAMGLGIALVFGDADLSLVLLAANLGLVALSIIVLATVTTTFMDAYSAGVSFSNLYAGLDEKSIALIMTVLGTLLALLVDMGQYQNFLLAIGSVFAPLYAIVLTDYFVLGNRVFRSPLKANWGALVIWALGVALYYQVLELGLFLGATIPVMVITGLVYIVVERFTQGWSYFRI